MYEVEDILKGTKIVGSNEYWADYFGWAYWGRIKADHLNRYVAKVLP